MAPRAFAMIVGVVLGMHARGQGTQPPSQVAPAEFAGLPETQSVVAAATNPAAVRGGVLILPLLRRSESSPWPTTLSLRLDDGRTLTGPVVSIERHEPTSPSWTSPRLVERTTAPMGDGNVALLVPLPTDSSDALVLGAQRLEPQWLDPLTPAQGRACVEPAITADDSPDPAAPNEYFRAVLHAHRLRTVPPALECEGADALYARAIAGMWSAAIARLAEQDPVLAEEILSDLAGRARGECGGVMRSIAAWETNEEELAQLLRRLLEPGVPGVVIVESARAWLDGRAPVAIWVIADEGESVVLAVANPRRRSVPLELSWPQRHELAFDGEIPPETLAIVRARRPVFGPEGSSALDPATALAVEEHGLGRLLPPGAQGAGGAHSAVESQVRIPRVLIAQSGGTEQSILVGTGRLAARPPGLGLGVFVPTVTLAQVRAGTATPPPQGWSTSVGLRRRPAGWELIVECAQAEPKSVQRDDVTLTFDAGFARSITLSSDGRVTGAGESVESEAAFASSPGRWRSRVPIPDEWIGSAAHDGHIALSASRSVDPVPGASIPEAARRQFAGLAPPRFDSHARPLPIDLSSWSLSSVTLGP